MKKKNIVIASPFLIIAVNLGAAYIFGNYIGKRAFVPMILIGWSLWLFFIVKYGSLDAINKWLNKPKGKFIWSILALAVGLIPLPIFLLHNETLAGWQVWLPWILLALINPWIEEFYWRGLLLDYTKNWSNWTSILFTSILFALNHIAFGINSEVNRGLDLIIATFIMGIVWAIIYKKTGSLRWAIFSHFLVDFLNLSAPAFLDLFEKGSW